MNVTTMTKKKLDLEKYRRRQDRIADRLLEMAGRNPFDPLARPLPGRPTVRPTTAKKKKGSLTAGCVVKGKADYHSGREKLNRRLVLLKPLLDKWL